MTNAIHAFHVISFS